MNSEIRTESGTAVSIGIASANSGTATSDSPKPNVDRTSVATKLIAMTNARVEGAMRRAYRAQPAGQPSRPVTSAALTCES